MKRALTMVEMLVATALLALVMIAGAQWLGIAGAMSSGNTGNLSWRNNAEMVAELVHDALFAGDRTEKDDWRKRVQIGDGNLQIATRSIAPRTSTSGGPEQHEYRFDEQRQRLMLHIQFAGDDQNNDRVLINDIATWSCTIEEENAILTIEMTSTTGEAVERRYQL